MPERLRHPPWGPSLSSTTDAQSGRRGVYTPTAVLLGFLAIFAVSGMIRSLDVADETLEPARLVSTVNPNTAPWWELTVVPRIGPMTAMAIVHEREQARWAGSEDGGKAVFRNAGDLDRVRGIGPATVVRIAPYLHFNDARPSH